MSEFEQDLQDEELDFLLMDKEGASPEPSGGSEDPSPSEEKPAPSGELKPTLHGDLTQVNLPDIFQSLVMSQMEGTLQVNSKWKVTYVHHEGGMIRILLPEEDWLKRIGYRLLSSGLVDGRDLKAALRRSHKEQVDLGQILMEDYGTDPEQFRAIRRALEEDAIFELFTQNRGNFAFYGDAFPDPDLERRFATCQTFEASQILLEVARRSDEWQIILRDIEDINEIMRPTQDAYREGVELDEIEENLLSHLDGTRSLSDIAGGMLYCLFDVMKAAQTILQRGLIEKVPTEDLFALTEADIHAEQEKRAVYYLNLVSTFRKPLPLDQLQYLAELQIRVNRPRDAGKTYADCAAIAEDDETRLHYLYESKRLDPRNPETQGRLLDALALHLSTQPLEEDADSAETDEDPIDEDEIHPELALDGEEAAPPPPSQNSRRKNRSLQDKREDFRDLSIELADSLLHRDETEAALHIINRVASFGFTELKIPILKSKILCKEDNHAEATKVLIEASATYRKEGRQKELTHCLEQVLKLDPSNSKIRNELRDLRSRFNRRVRRLLVASLVFVVGTFGAWRYYEGMQLTDRAEAMILEASQKSRSPDSQQLAQALGILAEVRRIAPDTDLSDKAQEITDQILAEKARRRQSLIDKKEQEFNSLAKAARTSFLQGRYTKALRLYLAMAYSKAFGKRTKSITEQFLTQQEDLAAELTNELNKLASHPLPKVAELRNREEYKEAQIDLESRFPLDHRQNLQRFVEMIRLGIFERHPFLAKKGTEPIPTLSTTLFGHDKIPERYDAIQKILSADEGLPRDLTQRIRSMDMQELDSLQKAAHSGGFTAGMSAVEESGILSSPAKTLYLDLLDYLRKIRDILETDPEKIELSTLQMRLAEVLKAPPFQPAARLDAIEKEIGDLVARTKALRLKREARTRALGKALLISNDTKLSPAQRRKRLKALGLAHDIRKVEETRAESASRYLNEMTRALDEDASNYSTRLNRLYRIQKKRDWMALDTEESDLGDAELMAVLFDKESERPLRAQRTRFAMLVNRLRREEEPRISELEDRHARIQSFLLLLEKLSEEGTSMEDKLAACKDYQLQIEVLLLRDGGKIQEIEEARRIGHAGILGRYMALLTQVEIIEDQLADKLSTNSSIRVINKYFLDAEAAFKELRFKDSLANYEKLLKGYRQLRAEDRDSSLLAQFERDEIKLRDICERLDEIEVARRRNDHRSALEAYRYLTRYYPDVNFKQVVRLPILISSVPKGALIVVNGKSMGVTPRTLAAPADTELRIEIRLQGFKTEVFEARTSEASRFVRHLEIRESWIKNFGAAITTPPTIDKKNQRVLLSDRRGHFRCLDLETGKVAYSHSFKSLSGEFDQARIYGNRFLLASGEGVLRRFDLASGKRASRDQQLGKALLLPSSMLGRDLLLTTKEGELLILNPSFEESPNPLLTIAELKFSPITNGTDRIFAATTDGRVRCWNKDGQLLWERANEVEGCGWKPMVLRASKLLVPTDSRKLHCLDALSGRRLWTAELADELAQRPALDDHKVYCATLGNELVILDIDTGRITSKAEQRLPGRASGPLAVWGDSVLIPIQGAGIRFYDIQRGLPMGRIGGRTTSEIPCILYADSFLFFSTKGHVRSYPTAPLMLPAKPR